MNHRLQCKLCVWPVMGNCGKCGQYLELICAGGSLLFDTRQHVVLHFIKNWLKGRELSLQVFLHSGGVCLVAGKKKKKGRVSKKNNDIEYWKKQTNKQHWFTGIFVILPPSCRGFVWGCRRSLKFPHSSWSGCGWSSAEIPDGTNDQTLLLQILYLYTDQNKPHMTSADYDITKWNVIYKN